MPSTRIHNTAPNTGIRGTTPHIRVSNFQTGVLVPGNQLLAGSPIGLLLALTYAEDQFAANTFRGDSRPNVRIRSL